MKYIPPQSYLLLIGGGTGWILPHLPDENLKIVYLEASAKMIHLAPKYVRENSTNEVVFIHGTEANIPTERPFDIVFTPFFLDLFEKERFTHVFFKLDHVLKNGGKWLWVDFVDNQSSGHQILLRLMYVFFRLICGIKAKTLPPVLPFFYSLGYKAVRRNFFFKNFISSKVFLKKS